MIDIERERDRERERERESAGGAGARASVQATSKFFSPVFVILRSSAADILAPQKVVVPPGHAVVLLNGQRRLWLGHLGLPGL